MPRARPALTRVEKTALRAKERGYQFRRAVAMQVVGRANASEGQVSARYGGSDSGLQWTGQRSRLTTHPIRVDSSCSGRGILQPFSPPSRSSATSSSTVSAEPGGSDPDSEPADAGGADGQKDKFATVIVPFMYELASKHHMNNSCLNGVLRLVSVC